MRTLNVTILIMTLFLIVACQKEDFHDGYTLDKIEFFNSSLDDLNYITIVGYEQGGEFKKNVDSTIM